MTRFFVLFFTFLLSPFSYSEWAYADDNHLRDQILTSLGKQTQKKFHFVQEKKLSMLDKPLITEGELLLDKNNTVTWDIQKPYTLRYILTQDSIREIDAQGERTLQTSQNPIAAALTQAMTATFSGQWNDSNTLATIAATGTLENWQLLITPQAPELQPLIKTLFVTGNNGNIASVVIAESNGDSTTIHLQALPTL